MAKILAVGIATLDIINHVSHYPQQDSEIRALSQTKTRGGNATNTLSVLSQLGHHCHWAGVLIQSPDSQPIIDNLARHNINTNACWQPTTGKMPTSYITLAQDTASRTIVHVRDCPEYDFAHFSNIDLNQFDWIHFEGRHIYETKKMLQYLQQQYPHIPCSLEVEKDRPDIIDLFTLADVLLFSKNYAESQQYQDPQTLLNHIAAKYNKPATCTWGDQGAWSIDMAQQLNHHQIKNQTNTIDTLGAGDTFNAGLIDQLSQHKPLQQALIFATKLASHKCRQQGLEDLLVNFDG